MKKRSGVELKKSFDFRKLIIPVYVVFFLIYLAVGLIPAEAANSEEILTLQIPIIELEAKVIPTKLKNFALETPTNDVGSFSRSENKIFLFGHASGIFKNLPNLREGDEIVYESMIYYVKSMIVKDKSMISMGELLKAEDEKTLVLMTCAGESIGDGDATHRLIVTAVAE